METVVISLGGSVLAPAVIDYEFLKKFRALLLKLTKEGKKFIIICGGGKTAREYMVAASKVVRLADEDLDWLGIHATRLNAHLLRTILRDIAHKRVIRNPNEKIDFKEKVLIAAGWKPGWSTDHVAVLLAKNHGAKTVINISNVDNVYDRDPLNFPGAKPLDKISWKDFRKMVGDKWSPGLNTPFDPVASKKAEKFGLKVVIMGKELANLEKFLLGKPFKGTIID
ncbi:UMP kinase [Candidatus Woesearchaeota archaeon]|nr:UMP kinase [Candidatus Woesearchaeota archaeon]